MSDANFKLGDKVAVIARVSGIIIGVRSYGSIPSAQDKYKVMVDCCANNHIILEDRAPSASITPILEAEAAEENEARATNKPTFKIGDSVHLRGFPNRLMTITGECSVLGRETVDVTWMVGNGQFESRLFPTGALVLVATPQFTKNVGIGRGSAGLVGGSHGVSISSHGRIDGGS